jgi:outer membrane protein OmpA-like peptidoglycan-associated protein
VRPDCGRRAWLLALLVSGCATPAPVEKPAPKPTVPPELMSRIDQDVARIHELADLDRQNEEKAQKLAAMEKTVADLQARLDGAVKSQQPSAPSAQVSRDERGRIKVQIQPNVQRIVVEGHTDSWPAGRKWEDNWQLSAERAHRVVSLLASIGVTRRMVASGLADSEPVATGDDEESRRKNRRVELFIETAAQ